MSANTSVGPACSSDPNNRKRAARSNIAGVGLRSRASARAQKLVTALPENVHVLLLCALL
eukprot:8602050-Pyramimonas_sp.AAC.1